MIFGSQSVLRGLRPLMLGFAVLAWISNANAQDIYKWLDSNGVTQYSATPPPPGISATVICAAPTQSAEAVSQAKADAQRMSDDANRRVAELLRERTRQQVQDEAERRGADARLQRCANARVQLDTLGYGVPVYRYNDRGERVYLEDSARDAEVGRLRREVATHCSGAGSMQAVQDAATWRRVADVRRLADCNDARDFLRDLEADISKVPSSQVEQARKNVALACADIPQAASTDWFGLRKVVRIR